MMLLQLKSKLTEQAHNMPGRWDSGSTMETHWRFGTEYTYRTMVALIGLGANTTDIAIYPKTEVDSAAIP